MLKVALLFCFTCSLVLERVSAIKTLKDIKDLKRNANFVKEFPRHGLMLLYWFAHMVENNEKAIQLLFDPGRGDYGLCRCRNEMTDQNIGQRPTFQSESYYSLGDLSQVRARMLPSYVTQDFHNSKGSQAQNMDRLLIKVHNKSSQRVERVFLTQSSPGTVFDPVNTYEISTHLLIQIRNLRKGIACDGDDSRQEFRRCEFLDYQQKALKAEMIYPKTPGLAWFLTLAGYNIEQRLSTLFCSTNNPDIDCYPLWVDDDSQCYGPSKIKLEVKSTSNGYARIVWSGIPENVARMEVSLGLYRDGTKQEPLKEYPLKRRTFGSIDTSVPLNPGLQARLVRRKEASNNFFFSTLSYKNIWSGPEFDDANSVLPTRVKGYDMSLQVYTKEGYACARLYIKKSFTNWRTVFDNSWVGFYANSSNDNHGYRKYEWVLNFEKGSDESCPLDYDVYEHESSLDVSPGVQVRLMLTKHVASEKARTAPWEETSNSKLET